MKRGEKQMYNNNPKRGLVLAIIASNALFLFATAVFASQIRYDGFKALLVTINSQSQLDPKQAFISNNFPC